MLRRFCVAALTLAVAGACADLATQPERTPSALQIESDTLTVLAGEVVAPRVTVLDQNGQPIPIPSWGHPQWSTSDNRAVGVEGTALRALAPGKVVATARLGELAERLVVRVNPHRLQLRVSGLYLTQSVQRLDGSVPLVAGRDALLRVFVTGDQPSFFRTSVRVTLYLAGVEVRSFTLTRADDAIPQQPLEQELGSSWNVLVPGDLLTPGVSLVVEADPEGAVPLAPGSQKRYPADGTLALDVRAVPKLWVRMVPVHQTSTGTTGRIDSGNLHMYREPLLAKFPIADSDFDLRSVYTTDARLDSHEGWVQLIREIAALREADASGRYYYGLLTNPPGSPYGGLGYVGYPTAIGYDRLPYAGETFAHELGHNFSLRHAPCGGPSGVDPSFPYRDGSIGVFGYDIRTGTPKDPGEEKDLMTYCSPEWISDYSYEKTFAYRHEWDWTTTGPDAAGPREPALLLWGGVQDGRLVLEPAFELEMRPRVPRERGPYRVEGYDAAGGRLFSVPFAARPLDHREGDRSFAFALPTRLAQPDRLERLVLRGPEGEVEVRRSAAARTAPASPPLLARGAPGAQLSLSWRGAAFPMALVRDARTGEVLSFARGGQALLPARGPVEVLLSDGVRTVRSDVQAR